MVKLDTHTAEELSLRVSNVSIAVNILLTIGKLIAGFIGHSAAMVSDAIHSASDVFSTLIVIVGIKISGKKSDREHQYGHEKMECIAALILAFMLFITGIGLGANGVLNIVQSTYHTAPLPTTIALAAAIVSIIVKEWMYHYTMRAACATNFTSLKADAWHHRSDALSSIGSLIGIGASMYGYPIMDSVASIVISFMILLAAISIFRNATDQLVDHAVDPFTVTQMKKVARAVPGVDHVDRLQTRMFGAKIFVDIEISANDNLTLAAGHRIASAVHTTIEENFPSVKHCMVHVNPTSEREHEY